MTEKEIIMNLIRIPRLERNKVLSSTTGDFFAPIEKDVWNYLKTNEQVLNCENPAEVRSYVIDYVDVNHNDKFQEWVGTKTFSAENNDITKNAIISEIIKLEANHKFNNVLSNWESTNTPLQTLEQMSSSIKSIIASDLMNECHDKMQISIGADMNLKDILIDTLAEERRIKTHTIVDKLTFGGFFTKSLNIFQAGTNVGKTFTMINICCNTFFEGGVSTLFISLETPKNQIVRRIVSNRIKKPIKNLTESDINEFISAMNGNKNIDGKWLVVAEKPSQKCTVGTIRNIIEKNEIIYDTKFDIVCIDYLGLIKLPGTKRHDLELEELCVDLRSVAMEKDICIVSVAQVQRSAQNGNGEMSLMSLSNSKSIADTVDSSISIERIDKEFSILPMKIYKYQILKTRYGPENLYGYVLNNFVSSTVYDTNGKIYQNISEYSADDSDDFYLM